MKIKYLIVDDEQLAHTVIEAFCEDIAVLERVGNCYHALQAMEVLHTQPIDIVFLDINMPKVSGISFIRSLAARPQIILTTAYSEYALEGFELDVCDYLLKPFSFERFLKAVNRAIARIEKEGVSPAVPPSSTETQATSGSLLIKADKKVHRVFFHEIYYIESYGSYVKVHLQDRVIVALDSLKNLESVLPAQLVTRIHKSYLVFADKVSTIGNNEVTIKGTTLPVGAVYKLNLNKIKS